MTEIFFPDKISKDYLKKRNKNINPLIKAQKKFFLPVKFYKG
jgi:hypothetical protein